MSEIQRQAARQIELFLEDGVRERLIVALAILDPKPTGCPACGSSEHDGWTNHADCPEDWTHYTGFEARRMVQLANERVINQVFGKESL